MMQVAHMAPVAVSLAVLAAAMMPARAEAAERPSIVLVHGAWADGSSWDKIIPLLRAKGLNVVATQDPLSSLGDDVASVERTIARQPGPVLLVGHSWGGAVITQAGGDPKVVGLVYVAAMAPDQGVSFGATAANYPTPGPATAVPDAGGWLIIPPEAFAANFAQDLPKEEALVLAAGQGASKGSMFGEPLTVAAWTSKPSWYVIATHDRMIDPGLQAIMAKKIKATTISLSSSHVPMISHPREVADLIEKAADTLAK
jgi:pimeloyl-ACP methyl ester carboxylesterase